MILTRKNTVNYFIVLFREFLNYDNKTQRVDVVSFRSKMSGGNERPRSPRKKHVSRILFLTPFFKQSPKINASLFSENLISESQSGFRPRN